MPKEKYLENLGRITGVNKTVDENLRNIAKNIGISKSELIRKKIRERLAEFPDELKIPNKKSKTATIDITELTEKIRQEISAIASNKGVSPNALWKFLLFEIAESFPEKMKRPYVD